MTADADPVLTRETTFHPRTSALTKSFVEYRGYWLPHCFDNEGAIAEYWACRERAAIMDLSPLRKWEVLGPDAETLIQRDDHARRAPAVRRPGDVHGALQRDGRDDRRRHGLPTRAGQLPLRRRRRVRRRLAEGARRPRRARGCGSSPRPTSSTTSPSRARRAATSCRRSCGRRRRRPRSRTSGGSASPSVGSGRTTGSRSSSRGPGTRASSATRSGAIPPTGRRSGTRSRRRGRITA